MASTQALGQVLVVAMFLQETDLKNGNIGLDDQSRVAKIDGDWCFSEGRIKNKYGLTPSAIASLPYPKDFHAFNWLDLVKEGIASPTSEIVNPELRHPELRNAPQFQAEVNQAIMKNVTQLTKKVFRVIPLITLN